MLPAGTVFTSCLRVQLLPLGGLWQSLLSSVRADGERGGIGLRRESHKDESDACRHPECARDSHRLLARFGEVALAGVQDDRLVPDEVADRDRVGDVVGQGSVAAVGDGPFGAADGGGAVLALGGEFALGAGVKQLEGLGRECGGGGVGGLGLLAGGVAGGALERALDDGERGQPLAGALVRLGDLEDRAAERPRLRLGLLLLALGGRVARAARAGPRWSGSACRAARRSPCCAGIC